ncbi:hypothetical protein CUJ83_01065 [Methanocella sp. CWC-04]|uniref:AMP-dependent synthetase/ligase domain-containing protein n=2 Tax=Methanooceanicella nereidis TaxID=2052831 RepID=A0AAP2RAR9_9EURY|nr:hypothetical protein [Methanocella sp. CWC-04]
MEKLDQKSIVELQNRKLRAMMRVQISAHHAHYRGMLEDQGIDVSDIAGVEDLHLLPFTTQDDVAKDPSSFVLTPSESQTKGSGSLTSRMQYFFYDTMLDNPRVTRKMIDEYHPIMMFETRGTMTSPYYIYLTGYDVDIFKELCGRGAMCAGLTQNDRYQNTYPYGQYLDFWQAYYSTSISMRVCSMSTGQQDPVAELEAARRFKTTVVAGSPFNVYYFAREAARSKAEIGSIRKIILSGYAIDSDLKEKIRGYFSEAGANPEMLEMYSLTECKHPLPECAEGSGFHSYPDVLVWECVDEKTGEVVGPGERGELVFTCIDGRGLTFLRYRTGDVAGGGIVYDTCNICGRTVPRIIGPIKKAAGTDIIPDIRMISRKLLDVEGVYCAFATKMAGDTSRILIKAMPDGTITDEKVKENIIKSCGSKYSPAIRLEKYL